MSSVRVEPNVIDYIVCPSFSLTYYYRPVCAIGYSRISGNISAMLLRALIGFVNVLGPEKYLRSRYVLYKCTQK